MSQRELIIVAVVAALVGLLEFYLLKKFNVN